MSYKQIATIGKRTSISYNTGLIFAFGFIIERGTFSTSIIIVLPGIGIEMEVDRLKDSVKYEL